MTVTAPRTRSASPSTRSGGGGKFLLFLVVLVLGGGVGYLAVTGKLPGGEPQPPSPRVAPTVSPTIITDQDTQVMLPPGFGFNPAQCTATSITGSDRRCGDLKVLPVDASRIPYISRGIVDAWMQGHPFFLHRNMNKEAQNANRREACRRAGVFTPRFGGQCDEYPFASSLEGGDGAHTEEVPARENQCQGGLITAGLNAAMVADGEQYLVVIIHPENIPPAPFAGQDIAEDKSSCLT